MLPPPIRNQIESLLIKDSRLSKDKRHLISLFNFLAFLCLLIIPIGKTSSAYKFLIYEVIDIPLFSDAEVFVLSLLIIPIVVEFLRIAFKNDDFNILMIFELILSVWYAIKLDNAETHCDIFTGALFLTFLFSITSLLIYFIKDKNIYSRIPAFTLCMSAFVCYYTLPAACVHSTYDWLLTGKRISKMLTESDEFELWHYFILTAPFVAAIVVSSDKSKKLYPIGGGIMLLAFMLFLIERGDLRISWGLMLYSLIALYFIARNYIPQLKKTDTNSMEEKPTEDVVEAPTTTKENTRTPLWKFVPNDIILITSVWLLFFIITFVDGPVWSIILVIFYGFIAYKFLGENKISNISLFVMSLLALGINLLSIMVHHVVVKGDLYKIETLDYIHKALAFCLWLVPIIIIVLSKKTARIYRLPLIAIPVIQFTKFFLYKLMYANITTEEEVTKVYDYISTIQHITAFLFLAIGMFTFYHAYRQSKKTA